MPFLAAQGSADTGLLQAVEESFLLILVGAFPGQPVDRVVRDQVDFGMKPSR